jgi:hypothetical protein
MPPLCPSGGVYVASRLGSARLTARCSLQEHEPQDRCGERSNQHQHIDENP